MPSYANYGGVPIFGRSVQMVPATNPPAVQVNEFLGINGVASVFLGTRGTVFEVTGVLSGSSSGELFAAEQLFRSFIDGIGRTLIDTYGAAWQAVRVDRFLPQGKIENFGYGYLRPYKAVLVSNR